MGLVTVVAYRDVIDAELARTKLESAGIPARVFDQHVVGMQWLYSRAIGGVKVKVEEADLEAARAALREDRSADLAELPGAPGDDAERCPACGSPGVRGSRVHRNAAALSLLSGLPLVAWRRRRVCEACGHAWKAAPGPPPRSSPETADAEARVHEPRSFPLLRVAVVVLLVLLILYHVERLGRSGG